MPKIRDHIKELLDRREFVSIATVDKDGRPNSVPKFIFRAKANHCYLIDYVMGKTVSNLRENPYVSVSFMDLEALEAYRLNGTATLIEKGPVFNEIFRQWDKKLVQLSTDRVIQAVRTGKKNKAFELAINEKFVVIKIRVESAVKIGRRGEIWQESD